MTVTHYIFSLKVAEHKKVLQINTKLSLLSETENMNLYVVFGTPYQRVAGTCREQPTSDSLKVTYLQIIGIQTIIHLLQIIVDMVCFFIIFTGNLSEFCQNFCRCPSNTCMSCLHCVREWYTLIG